MPSVLRRQLFFWGLCLGYVITLGSRASAEMIAFTIDPTSSSLTFTGSLIVSNPGFSDVVMPIQTNIAGDNLTTRLSGSLSADPLTGVISSAGPVAQVDNLQGSVMNPIVPPAVRVGAIGVTGLTFLTNSVPAGLITQTGTINYSVSSANPLLNVVGARGLTGGFLALGTPTFGIVNGVRTVDMSISFNTILPTVQNGVSLATQLNGTIHGIAAVPEPTHLAVLGLVGVSAMRAWRGRYGSRRKDLAEK